MGLYKFFHCDTGLLIFLCSSKWVIVPVRFLVNISPPIVRHDDECRGIPCEIAPFVMVNHWGTIILAEPLELPDGGRRYINEDTDWNYAPFGGTEKNQKPCVTAEEFIKTYVKQE